MRLRIHLVVLVPLICALWSTPAQADGHVLKVEGDTAYISLGAKDGLGAGSELTLMHTVVAKDPDGRSVLRGEFPVGTLQVLRVGEHLGVAKATAKIAHRLKVGSLVTLSSEPRVFVDPWLAQSASEDSDAALGSKTEDRETRGKELMARAKSQRRLKQGKALSEAFVASFGEPIEAQILAWTDFSKRHPKLDVQVVASEIRALATIASRLEVAQSNTMPADVRQRSSRSARFSNIDGRMRGPLAQRKPKRAYEGEALSLAFWVDPSSALTKATVYYRSASAQSYQWLALAGEGDGYLRATIPADAVQGPLLQYFVEAQGEGRSDSHAVLGTMQAPISVVVEPSLTLAAADVLGRSQVRLFSDYVDFDGGLDRGFDQYFHMEADFMYRFFKPIYSVRLGFGTLSGTGGPKDIIDLSPTECLDENDVYRCRRVAYNYVYSEFEFRLGEILALMIRPQFGTGNRDTRNTGDSSITRCTGADIEDCDFFSSFGARARIRFGEETSSNLTLGLGFVGDLGTLFEAAFTWDSIKNVPVVLTAQVADQLVPEDFGVRLIADVGWRSLSWVYPSLRISYQARDVDHAGISGGGAVNFDW